jgi:hypothetical protein
MFADRLCGLVVIVSGYRSRGPGFDSRRYQIFWEVMGLDWGPLSLMSTIEELLWRKSSGSSLENPEYGRRDPLFWPCNTLYPQKLALISPTNSGHSVVIVLSRTKATEFMFTEVCRVVYLKFRLFSSIACPWTVKHSRISVVNLSCYRHPERVFNRRQPWQRSVCWALRSPPRTCR